MRHSRPVLVTLLAPTLVTLTLAGCGGSSTPKTLNKADFTQQANAVCSSASADISKLKPRDQAGLKAALQTASGRFDSARTQLEALKPPSADAADIKTKLFGAFDQRATYLRSVADAPDLTKITGQGAGTVDKTYLNGYGLGACAALAG